MRLLALCLLLAGLAACRPAAPPAPAEGAVLFPVQQEGQWGYIDATGRLVIPPQFERAWPFSGNRALVQLEGRFGYIDRTGRLVIPARYDDGWFFSEGLAPVRLDTAWQLIDTLGQVQPGADFELEAAVLGAQPAYDADTNLVEQGGRYGYATAQGQPLIDPRFERAWYFADGLARVQVDGRWGYIDRTGRLVIPAQFDRAWDFEGGLALVAVGDRYGYVDRAGRYVWEPSK